MEVISNNVRESILLKNKILMIIHLWFESHYLQNYKGFEFFLILIGFNENKFV